MFIRLLRVVILLIWLELGLVLILVPWSEIWDVNYFLYQYPALGLFVKNPYLRGAISSPDFRRCQPHLIGRSSATSPTENHWGQLRPSRECWRKFGRACRRAWT